VARLISEFLALLADQGAELDEVVGEDAMAAPDGCSVLAVESGAVPAVGVLEVADPAFGSSALSDRVRKARSCSAVLWAGVLLPWRASQ
jgi:hypothetical protein